MAAKKEDGVDTIAGTADVDIKAVPSTVKGKAPKSLDKYEKKEDEINKPADKQKTPVVSSVAQLRETAKAQGATVSTEQVAEARKVEEKTLEEGGKLHRPPASER